MLFRSIAAGKKATQLFLGQSLRQALRENAEVARRERQGALVRITRNPMPASTVLHCLGEAVSTEAAAARRAWRWTLGWGVA